MSWAAWEWVDSNIVTHHGTAISLVFLTLLVWNIQPLRVCEGGRIQPSALSLLRELENPEIIGRCDVRLCLSLRLLLEWTSFPCINSSLKLHHLLQDLGNVWLVHLVSMYPLPTEVTLISSGPGICMVALCHGYLCLFSLFSAWKQWNQCLLLFLRHSSWKWGQKLLIAYPKQGAISPGRVVSNFVSIISFYAAIDLLRASFS